MTKCYLDSNVLVYYKNELSESNLKAKKIISSLLKKNVAFCISSLVLDEFLHAIIREKLVVLKQTLSEVLDLPKLEIINAPIEKQVHLKIVDIMEEYTLRPRDAYHLLICLENNIDGFATFDQDFKKVFKAKVLEKAL